jgi:glycosyltransferase involved in cell wall biosynthesis
MKYLITDLNITLNGHKFGFVNNLLKYVEIHRTTDEFIFLVNRSDEFQLESSAGHIQVITLSEEEQKEINQQASLIRKSETEWKCIEKYATIYAVQRVILMELDLYQIEIGKRKSVFQISGIWFRPYSRMQAEGNSLKQKIQFLKNMFQKKILLHWALRNTGLDRVFILNDEQMPFWLNGKKPRFSTLPDPYFDYPLLADFDLRKQYNIPENNLILLQFGYMDERKNNENILAALNQIAPEMAKMISLLVIGKFETGYEEKIKQLKNGSYQLITRNAFISDEEMESTFSQSDVILRMNINFFGSSGVVGIAARHDKPVVVSDSGVMAELVEKYQLGDIINPYDLQAIQKVILKYLKQESRLKIDGSRYRDTHDLRAFAENLLLP